MMDSVHKKIVAPLIILHKMTDQFWLNDQFYDCIVCDESGGILLTMFYNYPEKTDQFWLND